jgi:hypothetical protein
MVDVLELIMNNVPVVEASARSIRVAETGVFVNMRTSNEPSTSMKSGEFIYHPSYYRLLKKLLCSEGLVF